MTAIQRNRNKPVLVLSLLLLVFAWLLWLLPLRTAILIGADEGFALSKATLYLKGYQFYTQVWNDQPLLHTWLIAQVVRHISASILAPRLMTVAFAFVLLTSLFIIALRISGLLVATLTVGLLMASPGFLELAGSCMVEVPAVTIPVAALCGLLVLRRSKWLLPELLAGVLFGTGLHIKFNAAIYLPLAALILWLRHRRDATPAYGKSLLMLASSVVASFLAVHWLIGEGSFAAQFKMAWESHIAPAQSSEYGSAEQHPFPWMLLLKNWDTTLPAVVGIVFCCRRLRQDAFNLLPLAWLAITIIVFVPHEPWWPYYYLHNSIPLCWCAALGIREVYDHTRAHPTRVLVLLFLAYRLCALPWIGARVYFQVMAIRNSPRIYSSLVLQQIARLKPFTTFMFTDQPVYSFHADIPLPPGLAVLSLKRLWSGEMTNERIAEEMDAIKPGIILLANGPYVSPFQALIRSDYQLIYEDPDERLYALKTVIAQADQANPP